MKKFLSYILLSACLLFGAGMPLIAMAQAGNLPYVPLEPIPGLSTNPDFTNPNNLPEIINAIFRIFITVGALLAVLSLAVGGIQYMVSSSAELKNTGINRAKAALWGIVLIAASWLILNTINPRLLDFKLTPCPPNDPTCTVTGAPSNNNSAGGNVQQNLGDPTKFSSGNPYGLSSLSATQGYAVNQALGCSSYNIACLGAQQYITYDPSQINTPAVQQAITNYNSNCSGASNLWIGNVKTIDGSVVGASGQTALVCAGPLQ